MDETFKHSCIYMTCYLLLQRHPVMTCEGFQQLPWMDERFNRLIAAICAVFTFCTRAHCSVFVFLVLVWAKSTTTLVIRGTTCLWRHIHPWAFFVECFSVFSVKSLHGVLSLAPQKIAFREPPQSEDSKYVENHVSWSHNAPITVLLNIHSNASMKIKTIIKIKFP